MARFLERLFGKRKLSDIRYDSKLKMLAHKIVDHSDSKTLELFQSLLSPWFS